MDSKTLWEVKDGKKIVYLHKYQQKVLESTAKYTFEVAGTGGGKSSLAPVIIADRMSKMRGCTVIFTEPTYYMLQHIAIPLVKDFFKDTYMQGKFSEKDDVFFENRFGTILFRSAEKPDFLEGVHADIVVSDELGQYRRRAWTVLSNRITLKDGQFFGLTTPYNRGWMYLEPYHEWKSGNPDYNCVIFPSTENPAFPKDVFEKQREVLSEEEFAMRYMAEFIKLRGLVFNYSDTNLEDFTDFSGNKYWTAMDFGWGHPTAILYFFEDINGKVHLFDEYIASSEDYEIHATDNIDRFKEFDIRRTYYDPSNPQGANEMKKWFKTLGKEDVAFIPAINNVHRGVTSVNTLLKRHDLLVNRPHCPELLNEFETCIYKGNEPSDEDTDLLDCLRYGVLGRESWVKPVSMVREVISLAESHIKSLFGQKKTSWLGDP